MKPNRSILFIIAIFICFVLRAGIYDVSYENFATVNNQDTAVLVVAYNRPDYLEKCIKSIEKNPESEYLTFIFALDGGPKSKQKENQNLIERSKIKNKIVLLREYNYGCPKNHIDSKRFAFDWCNFKKVIIVEEDIELSSSYFKFIQNLHSWSKKQYNNVGAVQGWSYCYMPRKSKIKKLNLVEENKKYWSFVTYCLDKSCWDKIKSIQYTFENYIDQIPATEEYAAARSKPWKNEKFVREIRKWVHSIARNKKQKANGNACMKSKLDLRSEFLSHSFPCNQDTMMGFSFYMNDLIKICPIVNRAIHVGRVGITTTEKKFEKMYSKIHLDEFNSDKNTLSFKLI